MTTTRAVMTPMKVAIILLILAGVNLVYLSQRGQAQAGKGGASATAVDKRIEDNAQQMMAQGRQIFRYDTFGDVRTNCKMMPETSISE